jgi:hypothetical protein
MSEEAMSTQRCACARGLTPLALIALLLPALSGCHNSRGTVHGKVTFKDEVVPSGTIAFYGPGDQVANAALLPDGTYVAIDVPLGEVKVAVTTPPPPDPKAAERLKNNPMVKERGITVKQEKVVSVPRKYNLPGTSGLSLTVKQGSQPFDIALK